MANDRRVTFSFDINLGTVISALGLALTLWLLSAGVAQRLTAVEVKVDAMWLVFVKRGQ